VAPDLLEESAEEPEPEQQGQQEQQQQQQPSHLVVGITKGLPELPSLIAL